MEIELFDISPSSAWPLSKQQDFEQLKVITRRILDKKVDVTNGFSEDLNAVVAVYARYADAEDAWKLCWSVCSLCPTGTEAKLQSCWDFFIKENLLKSNRKLILLCKALDIDTTMPKTDGKLSTADEISSFLPADVDANFVLEQGFYPYLNNGRTGYYFRQGEKSFTCISNFVMEPLMHVYSKQDNKRIISIHNGQKRSVLDLPSKSLISLDQFTAFCYEEGNYMFWGSKIHLMKILNTINEKFPVCYELKTLGWQPEGFFAWSNAIYIPDDREKLAVDSAVLPANCQLSSANPSGLHYFNDLGIVTVDDVNYFSPSTSEIYSGQRSEDDEYENDRYLFYKKPSITYAEWCALFHKVYPDHSIYGIAEVFISLFKDIIFKIDNNCPHLSAYGEKGTGKSKFAESINALFLLDLQPFNLNHGTDFAFFNRLSRFRNCFIWLDEFDDAVIKEDRFQSIKGAYDGAGRERGKGTNKNRTEIARVNGALGLTGQYLSTRDDNSALTRCIILAFSKNDDRDEQLIAAYDQIKKLEKKGITGLIVELLQHRKAFETGYARSFAETFAELREAISTTGAVYKERVLRNYCAVLNCYKFFCQHFTFPFTYEQVKRQVIRDTIRLSTQIAESDSLADFWNTVVYLLETGEIYEGFHFRIHYTTHINVKVDGKEQAKQWPAPIKLLCLRLTTIHKLYMEAHRKQTGKTGINFQSLELYIASARGYVGKNSALQFTERETGKTTMTSSYLFEYDLLGVPLEMSAPEAEKQTITIHGGLKGDMERVMVAGKPLLKYWINNITMQTHGGQSFKQEENTLCHDPNLSNEGVILSRNRMEVTGTLKLQNWTDKNGQNHTKRTMDVDSVRLIDEQVSMYFTNNVKQDEIF